VNSLISARAAPSDREFSLFHEGALSTAAVREPTARRTPRAPGLRWRPRRRSTYETRTCVSRTPPGEASWTQVRSAPHAPSRS